MQTGIWDGFGEFEGGIGCNGVVSVDVLFFLTNKSTGLEEFAFLARFLGGLLDPFNVFGELELDLPVCILMASSSGISPVSSHAIKRCQ